MRQLRDRSSATQAREATRRRARVPLLLLTLLACSGFEWEGRARQLARALEDGPPAERVDVVRRLADQPSSIAIEALLGALDDEDLAVRLAAAEALGRARVEAAVAPLSTWLATSDAEQRLAALRALGAIGAPSARDALARTLGDPDPLVRREAVLALGALGASGDREAIVPVLGALDDDIDGVRVAAVEALARAGDARAVVPLVGSATDPSLEVRAAAVGALGDLKDARALPGLVAALADPSELVHVGAIGAIGQLGDPRGIGALEPLLEARDLRVRHAALAAIGAIGGEPAEAVLADALATPALRASAEAILAATPPSTHAGASHAALIAALRAAPDAGTAGALARVIASQLGAHRSEQPDLAQALLAALEVHPDAAAPLRAALARTGDPRAIVVLLGAAEAQRSEREDAAALSDLEAYFARAPIDTRAADPLLAMLARTRDAERRRRIIDLLGTLGTARAAPALVDALGDRDARVRLAAVRALGRAGVEESSSVLGALEACLTDGDAEVRFEAAQALGERADLATVERLLAALTGRRPADRHALLEALGGALGRLDAALPAPLRVRLTRALAGRLEDRDGEAAAAALLAARRWGSDEALGLVVDALDARDIGLRRVATRGLGDFQAPEARARARALLVEGSTQISAEAALALGEHGDASDARRLVDAAARRPFPVSAAATFALARLARRGALGDVPQAELCGLAALREPYARANALIALAAAGAPGCPSLPLAPLLGAEHSPVVRVAAARLLGASAALGPNDRARLALCARRERDAAVAAACASPALPPLSARVDLFAYGASGAHVLRDSLIALRLADGTVMVAATDRNGRITLDTAADGSVLLEDPSAASVEP